MKNVFVILIVFYFSNICIYAQVDDKALAFTLSDTVEFENGFYKSGDFFFGGQPDMKDLEWMQSEGLELVINLRSEGENEKFADSEFNEVIVLKEMGVNYISLPVSGKDAYNPDMLEEFAKAMNQKSNKVLIHCAGGGRVRILFMAYLVKYQNYTVDQAKGFGKKLGYTDYMELLLGAGIHSTL